MFRQGIILLVFIGLSSGVRETPIFGPNIYRPCNLNDYRCIGNTFPKSSCNLKVPGFMKPAYTINEFNFEAPHFNSSYIDHNLVVTGQNRCFVSEYFINTQTNNAVLGIDCPHLNFKSNRTLIQHRPLQEDHVYSYRFSGTYPLIRLTTVLNLDNFNFCRAFTFAYVDALPKFDVLANNRKTRQFLSSDLSHLNIFERETFLYRASSLARRFVNSVICDFGCY